MGPERSTKPASLGDRMKYGNREGEARLSGKQEALAGFMLFLKQSGSSRKSITDNRTLRSCNPYLARPVAYSACERPPPTQP
jgi:hypothetical protein